MIIVVEFKDFVKLIATIKLEPGLKATATLKIII